MRSLYNRVPSLPFLTSPSFGKLTPLNWVLLAVNNGSAIDTIINNNWVIYMIVSSGLLPSIYQAVITWSRLGGIKFYSFLSEFWQCYKLFINYILRLHVQSLNLVSRNLSFLLLRSRFVRTKFSHVIASVCRSGLKK